jgi:hypothetical protein
VIVNRYPNVNCMISILAVDLVEVQTIVHRLLN